MARLKTSCIHRGNTFFADVEVSGEGDDRLVRVRYNGDEREARTDGFPAEVVAHLLLRDLVVREVEQGGGRVTEGPKASLPRLDEGLPDRRLLDL